MKIGLIDLDYNGKFPNLPLMKLSAWNKSKGEDVEWYDPFMSYDIVYVSKVFSWTPDYPHPINAKLVLYGGTGYQIRVENGKEVFSRNAFFKDYFLQGLTYAEHVYPDYSLYPELTKDTAYGFLTRGCPRGCKFCHVGAKEGTKSHKVADLSEFWRGQKNIVLCDPNILACKDWNECLQQLIDSKSYVDFNQGLDARMMNKEKAEMLNQIKIKEVHFAWDRYQDKDAVLKGLKMYADYAKSRQHGHKSIVYTIVNFDTTKEQDLERVYTLREMGYWAYIMIYDKEHCIDPFYKDLARWVNNRFIFSSCERFEDYRRIK